MNRCQVTSPDSKSKRPYNLILTPYRTGSHLPNYCLMKWNLTLWSLARKSASNPNRIISLLHVMMLLSCVKLMKWNTRAYGSTLNSHSNHILMMSYVKLSMELMFYTDLERVLMSKGSEDLCSRLQEKCLFWEGFFDCSVVVGVESKLMILFYQTILESATQYGMPAWKPVSTSSHVLLKQPWGSLGKETNITIFILYVWKQPIINSEPWIRGVAFRLNWYKTSFIPSSIATSSGAVWWFYWGLIYFD